MSGDAVPARLRVGSPVEGSCRPLSEVPDEVFATALVGPGVAVDPARGQGTAVAPVDGTLAKLHPHAFVVVAPQGTGILVHLGIDTVRRKGQGFELVTSEGDKVRAGQPIVRWNPAEVEAAGYNPICPVVALDTAEESLGQVRQEGRVAAGELLFTVG
jgi:sugar PTS system EIIA component